MHFLSILLVSLVTLIHGQTVTVTVTAPAAIQTATVTAANIVAMAGFASDSKPFCDVLTGKALNASMAYAPQYLVSSKSIVVGKCFNDTINIVPGENSKAAATLSCRGSGAVLNVWVYRNNGTCPTRANTLPLFGIVFPSGRGCASRGPKSQPNPPYELGFSTPVCQANGVPGSGSKTEFASVFNMFTIGWARGIGGLYQANVTSVNDTDVEALHHGVQVMVLDAQGRLAVNTKQYVSLGLVAAPGSSSTAWGRKPTLRGNLRVQPSAGVASFGKLGIAQAGSYQLQACLTGQNTVASNNTGCSLSAVFHVAAGPVKKMEFVAQPNTTSGPFSMYDAGTGEAVFTTKQGPVNVTWVDALGNKGTNERMARMTSGLIQLNVTCYRVGQATSTAKDCGFFKTTWLASKGYAEFWSFGKLRDGINQAFGAGAANFQDGYMCQGHIGCPLEIVGKSGGKITPLKTSWFLFKA